MAGGGPTDIMDHARRGGDQNPSRVMSDLYRGITREAPVGRAAQEAAGRLENSSRMVAFPMIQESEFTSMLNSAVMQVAQAAGNWKPPLGRKTDMGIGMEQALIAEPLVVHPFHPGHPDIKKWQVEE